MGELVPTHAPVSLPNMSTHTFAEIARLVARHAKDEGPNATAIDSLVLVRYRPGRNPHHALQALRLQIVTKKVSHVYEADKR
jgi:hypothetical protein